jgi:hypothetical protein
MDERLVDQLNGWPVGRRGKLAGRLTSWPVGKGGMREDKRVRGPDGRTVTVQRCKSACGLCKSAKVKARKLTGGQGGQRPNSRGNRRPGWMAGVLDNGRSKLSSFRSPFAVTLSLPRVGRPLPWPPFAAARAVSRARSSTIPTSIRPRTRRSRAPTQCPMQSSGFWSPFVVM